MPRDIINQIIMAEEIAREQKLVLKDQFKKFKSYVDDWKNFLPPEQNYLFLDKEGEGKVTELVIISPSSNFSLLVEVDGVLTYQGGYSRFEEISIHIDSIIAQQRGSKYILQVNDISFLKRIRIIIDAGTNITFQRLYCKYLLSGE